MRLLVTGAAGQLGRAFVEGAAGAHEVVARGRGELDLSCHAAVMAAVDAIRPDAIVNCAAYNAVDRAQDEPTAALATNAFAVRSLARAAQAAGAALVHYSTDFVFDGDAREPYTEESQPAPRSVYGQSKLLGEWFAADAVRHYVLRVESLFGGPKTRSSIDRIVDALAAGQPARVFVDRVVTPSYVVDVVAATLALLERGVPCGLYHCVNAGSATWQEVGREIAGRLGADPSLLVPVRVQDITLPAPRPRYCALSNAKLAAAGVVMPSWQDAIRRHLGRSA